MADLIMRLRVTGGFAPMPGLTRPQTVHGADLQPGELTEIMDLLDQSDFFDRAPPPSVVLPDGRTYELWISDGTRERLLVFRDPVPDQDLARIVSLIRAHREGR